jgi:PAP2 superfamily protein
VSALETQPTRVAGAPGRGRRRRPTGAAPPLPHHLGISGKVWFAVVGVLLVWVVAATTFDSVLRVADRADTAFLTLVAHLRTPWLTTLARGTNRIGAGWTATAVAGATVVAIIGFRRWRHLFTYLGALFAMRVVGGVIHDAFARPRPYGVTIVGPWDGFSMPAPPIGIAAAILMAITYTLVVAGRPRQVAKWGVAALVGAFAAARLYLAVDHPSDVVVSAALGIGFPLVAFRWFTPTDAVPVTYRRGKTAHLDISGRRGVAIREAVRDQLGLAVVDVKPVGLEGSGGSTPLRLKVAGDPETFLFAKLYAMSHVRADRWYKLGRTILYGRLEDEQPFQGVRRLVEYEDYTARLVRDVGIVTAKPYGVVEMTPEREYLLVTEFLEGAKEIGDPDAVVDDAVIDEGLRLIRKLWDAGLAHRDIKPANLLVRDGQLLLIDVAFVQVRPSPWRQAVDLANMMLVLAVRTDAECVYRRALAFFTPDEIAEAFAATRGVASPTQLRSVMKQDGRDLIGEFRRLAPPRAPIAIQRWSVRRAVLAAAVLLGTLFVTAQVAGMLSPTHIPISASPACGTSDVMILMAQSVPTASAVPCIAALPQGWEVDAAEVERGKSSFVLDSDHAGHHAISVTLTRPEECSLAGAQPVPTDEVGARRFERPEQLRPALRSVRYYLLPGACVTYRFAFRAGADPSLVLDGDRAIAFQPRAALAEEVRARSGLRLCGAPRSCEPDR